MRGAAGSNMPGAGGGANPVKELRDELARAKGELAKEARRRAEAEEGIAEMAGRAENQDEINDMRKEIISNMEKGYVFTSFRPVYAYCAISAR